MGNFIKKNSGFFYWFLIPSILLLASVMGVNLVSRPVISNPGESCSVDSQCQDSTGCFLEFCDTINFNQCTRSGINTSASNQACFQCGQCGNGTCEPDAGENLQTCPADCTFQGDLDVCSFQLFVQCNPTRNRCCPSGCQGSDSQGTSFDADCCNGCGDNQISGSETCDGTAVKTSLTPPAAPNTCRAPGAAGACTYCGDGNVDSVAGEQCDPPNGTTCGSTCQLLSCGDGVITPPEQCDPPNGTTCSATCQTIIPLPVCGNGILEAGEA